MLLHQEQLNADRLKPSTSSLSSSFADTQNQLSQLDAVIIRNLTYEVGRGKGKKRILNKINLTVPEGTIYGLLGPSGCGKTTMLRCVVGRVKARSGNVLVFGFQPGEERSEVPGKDVGYMPQEISIYEDFTIEETLRYFGKINRLSNDDIKKRIDFLLQFLDLPSEQRLVANLSGGQKRRVSLAAALVHSPPLLILDEPTVGVDPLLRTSIWTHLVTLTQTERISVIITTHYIEEARQANVVGLMRHGRILAENSPSELMRLYGLSNLEDVFLELCMNDSSTRKRILNTGITSKSQIEKNYGSTQMKDRDYSHRWDALSSSAKNLDKTSRQLEAKLFTRPITNNSKGEIESDNNNTTTLRIRSETSDRKLRGGLPVAKAPIIIHTGTDEIELNQVTGYANQFVYSGDDDDDDDDDSEIDKLPNVLEAAAAAKSKEQVVVAERSTSAASDESEEQTTNFRQLIQSAGRMHQTQRERQLECNSNPYDDREKNAVTHADDYIALQAMKWAARRNNELNFMSLKISRGYGTSKRATTQRLPHSDKKKKKTNFSQWWETLMAVTWKNYIRLRRNPPVLIFQFMLPAIQVILFCLCIGGEPFDVPVAIVNDELNPRSSLQFLNGLNKKIITQIKYDNLSSAIEAVRRGQVWGAIHIPDKYSQNLQSRLIMGEEVTNETISNGTIRVYPDLTNLHLGLALETSFRETFIKFAKDSLEELGYDRSLADLPIQVGQPVYGNLKKDSYLEFMAPGVVISISYVMATGLTALAFILERRDGLLERSLVSGVHTTQILLAHAINQVFVMVIQIFLVLACTFFVFEIPSRGPFFWAVLLILLQGCTGMGFGLLVSAVCKEENTAVMMLVGTFYTNLILAGIIWPIEAMPHWLRPLSYAQPQTLSTDSLRHILSRGWGISEPGVLLGFATTIGWLVIFLMTAGLIFKYYR